MYKNWIVYTVHSAGSSVSGCEGEKFKISIQIKKYSSVSEWMKVLEQLAEQLPNIIQKEVKTVF